MKVNTLKTDELYIAGSIITAISKEMKKTDKNEEIEIPMKYVLKKLDDINKEIAGEIFIRFKEGIDKIRKEIEEN